MHFVDPATERIRPGGAVAVFEEPAEDRTHLAFHHNPARADDLEQQAVALDEELGSHYLHRRGLFHLRDAGRHRPRYDFKYNCDSLLIGSGNTTIFKPEPTTMKHLPKHNVDPTVIISKDQEMSFLRQVYFFHVVIIAPILIYVGMQGVKSDSRVFALVLALGILALLYHGGRLLVPRKRSVVNASS